LKALADTARSAAKSRFDEIEADPAYDAAVNDTVPKGQHSDLADTFMDKYILGAPRAALARIKEKFGDNPDMQEAMAGHTLNTLKDKARADVDNKSFLQDSYNNQAKKLSDKLDLLLDPATLQKVTDLGETARDVQKYPTGHAVNVSNTEVARAARQMGEAAIQMKTGGLGMPILRSILPDQIARRALKPGAGLDYREP